MGCQDHLKAGYDKTLFCLGGIIDFFSCKKLVIKKLLSKNKKNSPINKYFNFIF